MEPETFIQMKLEAIKNFVNILYAQIKTLPFPSMTDDQLMHIATLTNTLQHLHCPLTHQDHLPEYQFNFRLFDLHYISIASQILKSRSTSQENRKKIDLHSININIQHIVKAVLDLIDRALNLNIDTHKNRRQRLLKFLRRIADFSGFLMHTDTLNMVDQNRILLKLAGIYTKVAELTQSLQNYPHRLQQPDETTQLSI